MTVVKGRARKNGVQLASYLLDNAKNQNERIIVLEVRSGTTKDPRKAIIDMDLATELTKRGEKGIYQGIISPDPGEQMTAEEYLFSADIMESQIKFDGQNRVIIVHEKLNKKGELVQHAHITWQREKDGHLLSLSHNYAKHDAAREKIEISLKHKRTHQPKDVKQDLTRLWENSKDGKDFIKQANDRGYTIAQGDKRAYFVETPDGRKLNFVRQLPKDVKTHIVQERLKDIPLPHERELLAPQPVKDRERDKTRRSVNDNQKDEHASQEATKQVLADQFAFSSRDIIRNEDKEAADMIKRLKEQFGQSGHDMIQKEQLSKEDKKEAASSLFADNRQKILNQQSEEERLEREMIERLRKLNEKSGDKEMGF